jgi:hypothetical protein
MGHKANSNPVALQIKRFCNVTLAARRLPVLANSTNRKRQGRVDMMFWTSNGEMPPNRCADASQRPQRLLEQ